tara:strand:+ start:35603 stop:35917 length:315 start_codon:yes stop_codon:yes gene_type:complete
MCKQNNIENLDRVVCALKDRFRSNDVKTKPVDIYRSEMDDLVFNGKTFFYGLLEVGNGTTVVITLPDGSSFNIATPNSQIITSFKSIVVTGTNCYFSGYNITVN